MLAVARPRGSVSGNNSVVECDLAKVEVAGSNPVSRSNIETARPLGVPARFTTRALRRPLRSARYCLRWALRADGSVAIFVARSAPSALESALDQHAVLAEFEDAFRRSSCSASLKNHFDQPHSFRSSLSVVSIDAAGNPL